MIKIVYFFICLSIFSCASVQNKKDYVIERGNDIYSKYNYNGKMVFAGNGFDTILKISTKNTYLKKMSKRKLKHYINQIERTIASTPDSFTYKQLNDSVLIKLDSFYINPNKINFRKKYKF